MIDDLQGVANMIFNQVDRDFRLTDAHSSVVKEILA